MADWRSGSMETLPERMQVAIDEVDRLQAALATALRERDDAIQVRDDRWARHKEENLRAAKAEAERDQMRAERDALRAEVERLQEKLGQSGLHETLDRLAANLKATSAERDAYRAEVEHLKKEVGVWQDCTARVEPENDRLKAEVERLRDENQTAWNKASFLDEDLRHLRAVIAPTDENLALYDKAMRSKFHSSRPSDMARAVLAAIAARAKGAG